MNCAWDCATLPEPSKIPTTRNTTANLPRACSTGASRTDLFFPQVRPLGSSSPGPPTRVAAPGTVDLSPVGTKEAGKKFDEIRRFGGERAVFFEFRVETELHVAGVPCCTVEPVAQVSSPCIFLSNG